MSLPLLTPFSSLNPNMLKKSSSKLISQHVSLIPLLFVQVTRFLPMTILLLNILLYIEASLVHFNTSLLPVLISLCLFINYPSFFKLPIESLESLQKGTQVHSSTISFGLSFSTISDFRLHGFVDADYASSINDQRSNSGFCIMLDSNLLSWSS